MLSAKERKIREAARLALTESADGIPCVMPGDRLYSVLRKRTPNGTNYFDFYAFHPYPEDGPRGVVKLRLTYHVARAIGATYDRKNEALRTTSDDHSIVHALAWALWGAPEDDPKARLHVERIG